MVDLPGFLRTAEDEIVVLGAVVLGALELLLFPADFLHQGHPRAEDMRDVVVGAKQVRVVVRLEVRAVVDVGRIHELVLVRVDDVDLRIRIDRLHDLEAGVLLHRIVVVREHDPVAGSHLDGLICIAGDTRVDL